MAEYSMKSFSTKISRVTFYLLLIITFQGLHFTLYAFIYGAFESTSEISE